ncbi:GNAT family N-acetyltransferase [Actinomadura sp. WMMB 499]|uniref:GNAT family N-acetyltransferase n=1 Tax=Actinomadura sp. WMMB 499 TaxID=1219491 RepID=UPI001248EB33|nr:GNAT family N-acetyltransferase [Actinomadura sp. WMMB 499]QFG22355.1 GNAT family N-acetyltransferase [Actinomadura sp. WMMB 499]
MDLAHLTGTEAQQRLGEIEPLYAEAFPESDLDDYRWRMRRQMASPGFEAVTARQAAALTGFVYGLPLPAGTTWWDGLEPAAPAGFTTETGARTFAVIDLAVRRTHRGRGLGRRLLDELLAGRTEERATLATAPHEQANQEMYRRWGWRQVGRVPGGAKETLAAFDLYAIDLREPEPTSST